MRLLRPRRAGSLIFPALRCRLPFQHDQKRPMPCASTAEEEKMTATQTAHRQLAEVAQIPADPLKAFIETCLARNQTPAQIADAVKIQLGIEIDPDHVIPYWKGEITLPTQTERRQDKESVQIPADEENEPLFTRIADGETPHLLSVSAEPAPFSLVLDSAQVSPGVREDDAPATQTGRKQNQESR